MPECVRCGAKATTFACGRCTHKLRRMLADLPWWLRRLEETATGQARHGDDGRRIPRYRQQLDGDSAEASHIEPMPVDACCAAAWDAGEPCPTHGDGDGKRSRHRRAQTALRHALARGRVNLRASELADSAHSILFEWVRDLCETRGMPLPSVGELETLDAKRSDSGPPPWLDATDVHVADGDPGEYCWKCLCYHQGECA